MHRDRCGRSLPLWLLWPAGTAVIVVLPLMLMVSAAAEPADPPAPGLRLLPMCAPYSDLRAILRDRFDELPVVTGLQRNSQVLELYGSPKGSWTIVTTTISSGRSCVKAVGVHLKFRLDRLRRNPVPPAPRSIPMSSEAPEGRDVPVHPRVLCSSTLARGSTPRPAAPNVELAMIKAWAPNGHDNVDWRVGLGMVPTNDELPGPISHAACKRLREKLRRRMLERGETGARDPRTGRFVSGDQPSCDST